MINFPELDIKKIIVVVLISFMFIYSDAFIFLPMQIKAIKANKEDILKLERQINAIKQELENAKKIRAEADKEKKLEIKTSITEDQIPLLLHNISNIANKNDVKIMQVRPSKDVKSDVALGAGSLSPLSIIMDLSCDYHNLGKFINVLENARQFIKVSELRITPVESSYLKESVYLVITTYVKK